jgi:hypothetical protein
MHTELEHVVSVEDGEGLSAEVAADGKLVRSLAEAWILSGDDDLLIFDQYVLPDALADVLW